MFEKEWFPKANAIGVTWGEFWGLNPHILLLLIEGHNEKEKAEMQKNNIFAHLQGQYFAEAILSTVGNAFKKKGTKPHEYPKKPYEINKQEETIELTEEEKRKQTEYLFLQLKIMGANFNSKKNSSKE